MNGTESQLLLALSRRIGSLSAFVVLVLSLAACDSSGGGGSKSKKDDLRPGIRIEQGSSTSSRTSMTLRGYATVDNELGNCYSINCYELDSECRRCSSDTRVTWKNETTGTSGRAYSSLERRDCRYWGWGKICDTVTGWAAEICLAPGINHIVVQASGPRKGTATAETDITFNTSRSSNIPEPPYMHEPLSYSEQATLRWRENSASESVTHYTLYQALGKWGQWQEDLPGARKEPDLDCCEFTMQELDNGIEYRYKLVAHNCAGDSVYSNAVKVVPGVVPTTLAFTHPAPEIFLGEKRQVSIQVLDQVKNPIPDLVVLWSSSDAGIVSLSASRSPTDANGMAFVELNALREGTAVISARVVGTDIGASADVEVMSNTPGQLPDDFVPGIQLTAPLAGATLAQNNPATGCEFNENRGYGYQVEFSWNGIETQPGFIGYQLMFWHSGASFPVLQKTVPDTRYHLVECNSFVPDANLSDWLWWVEARFEGPLDRTIQSERRSLGFSSCRHDDGRVCSAGQAP